MSADKDQPPSLEPLKITCTSSKCGEDLHCFKASRKLKAANQVGQCRSCGATLVDWNRVKARDLKDAEHTFASLKKELIRHHFWHLPFSQHALNYAKRKGRVNLRKAVEQRLQKSVGSADPYRDGQQTPIKNIKNPIHHAQHATAKYLQAKAEVQIAIAPSSSSARVMALRRSLRVL